MTDQADAELDLGLAFDPTSRDALRVAYRESFYPERGITFEETLADTGLRLCLKNLAHAIHRRLTNKRT